MTLQVSTCGRINIIDYTHIASTVLDSPLSDPKPEQLAYFYCNRAEENRPEPMSTLNTLAQQLSQPRTGSGEEGLLKPVIISTKKGQRSELKNSSSTHGYTLRQPFALMPGRRRNQYSAAFAEGA